MHINGFEVNSMTQTTMTIREVPIRKEVKENINNTLGAFYFPELGDPIKGKVRDNYIVGSTRLMIASDRVSCFDHILKQQIPFKGQILSQIAAFWFDKTSDIIENHLINCPDPNVMLVHQCKLIPVEVIVRSYLTGSAWRSYKNGSREICGVKLPNGLQENHKFNTPIITPTTKAEHGHDMDITVEQIISQKLVSEKVWKQVEAAAIKIFIRGQEICENAGLILVDTKYEFGLLNDKVVLIDEIHTPDSSRFWTRGEIGKSHRSKEFIRAWLMEQGFMGREGEVMPDLTKDVIAQAAQIYIDIYEQITGTQFQPELAPILARLRTNLISADLMQGYFVPIIMGSTSDQTFCDTLVNNLTSLGIQSKCHVASAHKTPEKVMSLVNQYNTSSEPIVYITVAGRSNGLSGVTAASAVHPVIACPPFKDKQDYLTNINSTLQMPSETPVLTVVDPKNAVLAVARIFATSSETLQNALMQRIHEMKR